VRIEASTASRRSPTREDHVDMGGNSIVRLRRFAGGTGHESRLSPWVLEIAALEALRHPNAVPVKPDGRRRCTRSLAPLVKVPGSG